MDNYVGKRLDGRYEIQEIIGVGGMSVVYKAYDNVDDRIVAVKILKDEFLTNDEFVRRFKNESKAIALLSHPNIVKVYDVSFGEKLQYIVMEYVDGITLKEYIQKQNAITWNDALLFTTQILKALQHAHDRGIVHRDVKPQNIILLSNGSIKVADFGIARFSRSDTKTLTDTAIGSVHYISPEQAKGEFTDEKADIYSVGVVLYEMLAGKVPFDADNAVSVALMQLQEDAKRLTEINPDIPLGLEQICVHAMQKDPNDRYQTATEMLLDIEEVMKNPDTTFDYSYFVDKQPTKYVINAQDSKDLTEDDEEEEEYVEEYYDPNHKKKVITAVVIGVLVLIGAVVLLIMSLTGGTFKSTHSLESFVGMSYDEIQSSDEYDYEFIMQQEKTNETESGIVLSQIPEAGTKVLDGSQVTLVVAVTADDISVPNVYNLDQEMAVRALTNEGLNNYTVTSVGSDSVEEGKVVYTNPKAGDVVSADAQITIYVSSGPTTTQVEQIQIPDVKGLSQESARAFLTKMGFTNVNFVTEDSATAKGIVLSQSPAAGTRMSANDTIKITISTGVTTTEAPAKIDVTVKLPNYVDDTGATASDTLVVEVDGEKYLSKKLSMDGSEQKLSVSLDGKDSAQIKISLTDIGAVTTQTVNSQTSGKLEFDFSDFSNN